MPRLVSVYVEHDDGDAPAGHHRIVVTVDVRADSTWDAVGWTIEQLGRDE